MNLTFVKRCFLLGFLLALGILDDRSFVVEGKENANSLQQATSKHFSYLSNGFQNKLIKSLSFLRIQKLLLLPSKDKKNNKTNKNTNSATSATTTTQKKQKQQKAPKLSKETLTTEKTEEETKKETIESPEKVILPTTSLEKTQRRQDYFVQTIQFLYTIFTFYGVRIIMKLKSDNEQHQWILRMSFAGYLLFCNLYYFLLKFFISQRYKYSSVIEFVNIPPSKNPLNSLLQQFLNPKNGTVEEGGKETELTQRLSSNPLFAMLQPKVTSPSTTPSITIKEYDHEQNLQLFKSLFQDILWVLGCIYVMKKNYFTLIYWTIMNGIKARLVQSPLFYIYFFRFQSIGLLSRPFKSSLEMMLANFQNSMEIKTEIQEELQKLPTVVSGSEGKVTETTVSDSTLSTSSGNIPAPIAEDHSENTGDGRNNEEETKNSKHEATKKKAKTKKSEKKDSKKKNKRDKKENHSNKTVIEEDLKSVGETEKVKDSTIESSSIQQSNPSSINNPPDTVIKSSTDTLPTQSETEPAKSDIISHPTNSPSLIAQRESDLPKQDLSKKIEQNESFPSISSSFSGISIEEAVNALPADSSLLTVTEEEEEEAEALSNTSTGTVFDDPVLANLETLEELDTNDEANTSAFIDDELDHLPIDDLEDFDDEEDENGAINELQPSEDIANDIEEAVSAEEKELVDADDDELEDEEAGVSEELKEEDALEDSFQALDSLNHLMGSNDATTTEEELDFDLTNYDETDHLNDEEQTEETENVSEEAETTADEDDLMNESLQGQMDDIESLLNSLNNDFKR